MTERSCKACKGTGHINCPPIERLYDLTSSGNNTTYRCPWCGGSGVVWEPVQDWVAPEGLTITPIPRSMS